MRITLRVADPLPHFSNILGLELYQTVYAGGAISSGISLAGKATEMAENGKSLSVNSVRMEIARNYLELAKQRNLLKVYDENICLARSLLDEMKARHSQGTVLKNDITRYELRLSSLSYDRLATENAIRILNDNLVSLLGLGSREEIIPDIEADGSVAVEWGSESWLETASLNSPSLRAFGISAEMERLERRIARSEYLPRIGIVAADNFLGPVTFEVPALNKNYNALSGKDVASSAVSTSTSDVTVTESALAEVEVLLRNARKDLDRYKVLLSQDAVTRQQYGAVETQCLALEAKRDMLARQRNSSGLVARQQRQRLGQNDAGIEVAEAAVSLAELNLSYTVITALCDGVTSRRDIQPGQLIQPGQTIVSIVDTGDTWVIANYRETQTSRMAVGDSVRISVDALPDVPYTGVIEAFSNATGSRFSPVQHDNSAGNFVKVEQRIPVKIRFAKSTPRKEMARLRSGMNVECKVIR